MKPRFNIAVRALAEFAGRTGDLHAMGGGGALDGIRIHRDIQRSRDESYRPEFPVAHEFETDRAVVGLTGPGRRGVSPARPFGDRRNQVPECPLSGTGSSLKKVRPGSRP